LRFETINDIAHRCIIVSKIAKSFFIPSNFDIFKNVLRFLQKEWETSSANAVS